MFKPVMELLHNMEDNKLDLKNIWGEQGVVVKRNVHFLLQLLVLHLSIIRQSILF